MTAAPRPPSQASGGGEPSARSTVELANALGLKVVAEGVEDQEALDALAGVGCDYAQGYHFSRPLPAEDFAASTRVRAIAVLLLAG